MYRDSSRILGYILRYFNHERLRQEKKRRKFEEIYKNIIQGIETEFDAENPFKGESMVANE